MNFKGFFLALGANFLAIATANAAIVSPGMSATASFDVSGLTPGNITNYGYSCSVTCTGGNMSGDPLNWDAGAQIQVHIGTSAGADDIASILFTNPFGFDINNFSTGIPPTAVGSISTIFLTFIYVDDVFGVDQFSLRINGTTLFADAAVVPLPAALPLFIAGLAGLGAMGRRRRKKAA